jgi:hypothetical protein
VMWLGLTWRGSGDVDGDWGQNHCKLASGFGAQFE